MPKIVVLVLFATAISAHAQQPVGKEAAATQTKEMTRLAMMDGTWRGDGWIMLPTGKREELTQTERVGPMLDGAIKVIEGRGYDAAGKVQFNAFAVISYDLQKQQHTMRSYAQGRVDDFPLSVQPDGYTWEIPAGPAKIRYTAKIEDGKWVEHGERIIPNRAPIRFFEMKLERLGDTDWPRASSVKPE